jgi:hypothetical protein
MLRDQKRIDVIMEKVAELWKTVPNQRLCQVLSNAVKHASGETDVYYTEDEDLLIGIRTYKIWLDQMAKLK